MRRTLLLLGFVAALVLTQRASAVTYIASEQVTVDNTAGGVGFTATKLQPNGANSTPQATNGACRLETAEIRYQYDGLTAPTTTVGTLLEPGDVLPLTGSDILVKFRAIRTGAVSGKLSCNYWSN